MPVRIESWWSASELNIPVNVVDTPHLCDFIFPAIVDRNPIVIGISSNGKAPVLARLLRARLETLIPQGYGKLAKLAGEFRSEVKTKIPTLTGRRQFWERAFEGQVSQLMFAGNEKEAAAQNWRRPVRVGIFVFTSWRNSPASLANLP